MKRIALVICLIALLVGVGTFASLAAAQPAPTATPTVTPEPTPTATPPPTPTPPPPPTPLPTPTPVVTPTPTPVVTPTPTPYVPPGGGGGPPTATPTPTPPCACVPLGFHAHYALRQQSTGQIRDTGIDASNPPPTSSGGWEVIQILVKH